jgi:methylenetetrahydrofolate reductase (NADH)
MTTLNPIPNLPQGPSLQQRMRAGEFVMTVELVPPRTPDLVNVANRVDKFFIGHADAVNVTDCASAMVRMSSLGASLVCLQKGIEPVMQTTCRDRNRIALQSELLTAYGAGVRTVLCLTGDHVIFGDHPMAKPVFDLDSTNLIAIMNMMRHGKFASGEALKASPKAEAMELNWLIGGAANPYGNLPEHLAQHMDRKCRAGCDFIQTQPIYDMEGFDAWWRAMEALDVPNRMRIMPGILPPKSAKGLAFMKEHVSGVHVPDEILKRISAAEDEKAEGLAVTYEIIDRLLDYPIAGLHIYPVYYESVVPEMTAEIRRRAETKGFRLQAAAVA